MSFIKNLNQKFGKSISPIGAPEILDVQFRMQPDKRTQPVPIPTSKLDVLKFGIPRNEVVILEICDCSIAPARLLSLRKMLTFPNGLNGNQLAGVPEARPRATLRGLGSLRVTNFKVKFDVYVSDNLQRKFVFPDVTGKLFDDLPKVLVSEDNGRAIRFQIGRAHV